MHHQNSSLLTDDCQWQEHQTSEQQEVVGLVKVKDSHEQNSGLVFLLLALSLLVAVRDGDLPEQRSAERRSGEHEPAAHVHHLTALALLTVKRPGSGLQHGWKQTVSRYETNHPRLEVSQYEESYKNYDGPSQSCKDPQTRQMPKRAVNHKPWRVKEEQVDANC